MMKRLLLLALIAGLGCADCGNDSSSSSTTSPSAVPVSETMTGMVPAASNGILQSTSVPFTVASPGGSVSVTLTSAVETNPDGTTNSTVVMGVAIGSQNGSSCTLSAGVTPTLFQAGATSTLSGTAAAGSYCVQVSDVTNQVGPVAFTLVIVHP